MMEREAILSSQMDERRRKYYYLEHDILIDINLKQARVISEVADTSDCGNDNLKNSVTLLGRMIQSHDMILSHLEQVNHEIEIKMNDLARNHKDLFRSDREITVIIALSHDTLTFQELEQVTEVSPKELGEILKQFERHGLVGRIKDTGIPSEAYMKNNPNSPYDDVFNNLAKIVEDIVKNMPDNHHARIVGYTIITRHPSSGEPDVFPHGDPVDDEEIPYEVVESEDMIYITATMPETNPKKSPPLSTSRQTKCIFALITGTLQSCSISLLTEFTVTIEIHRGLMDITLKKVNQI